MIDSSPDKSFLDMATEGRGGRWGYIASIIIGSIFYIVVGVILFIAYIAICTGGLPSTETIDPETGLMRGVDIMVQYIGLNLSISPILFYVLVVTKFYHQRSLISLISAIGKIRWSLVRQGFVIWFVLAVLSLILELMIFPSNISWSFKPAQFLAQLPIVLLVTPIQTSTEELFFRGYILQAQALISKNIWLLAFFNGVLFLLPHMMNNEIQDYLYLMVVMYFGIGFFLSYVTIKTNGLEAALGAHAANNLFGLIVSYKKSSLPVESIFKTNEMHPISDAVSFTVMAIIFCFVISKFYREDSNSVE